MNWSIRDLKLNAKKNIKRNYIQFVIVCIVVAILAGGYRNTEISTELIQETSKIKTPSIVNSAAKILDNIGITTLYDDEEKKVTEVENKVDDKFNLKNATDGAFATIINNSGASKSFLVGILNTVNSFIFENRFLESTIVAIATILTILFWLFVQNILIVGQNRFFLENKNYSDTNIDRILFIYRIKKVPHVAYIMFCKFIFNFLWFFTIIGGFIKYYSYKMIPFIIAENPDISRKDAFKLSQKMMKGNKWKAFLLDLSFIFWYILSILTFGIIKYLYLNPLMGATKSELYYSLRKNILKEDPSLERYFNDYYLINKNNQNSTKYPVELYTIPEKHRTDWLKLDYDRKYSISSYILVFFTVAFIGWIWEVFLQLLQNDVFVNRGVLIGPWLPIYGTGAVIMLFLLKPLANKPTILFPTAMVICGILEYFTSWALEKLFNATWWDYSNVFFNINGRICLEGLLFFAIGGFLVIYFIAPLIDEISCHINSLFKKIFCGVLVLLFSLDAFHSIKHPNTGSNISEPISYNNNILVNNKKDI